MSKAALNLPSITVLMLCWNHARFIEKAITSLSDQTDKRFKVVFLDNASNDGSAKVAQSQFDAHGIDATVLVNEKPQGISPNLNKLLAQAGTEIVCVISADDWYHADYVSEVREAAKAYPCASLFYPMAYHYDDATGTVSERGERQFLSGNLWEYTRQLDWRFGFVGLAYRRSALIELGGWDEQIIAEDNDMLFRLSEGRAFVRIPKRLFYYRLSPSGISGDHAFVMKSWKRFFQKHRAHFPNRRRLMLSYTKSHIGFALRKRRYGQALRVLVNGLTA